MHRGEIAQYVLFHLALPPISTIPSPPLPLATEPSCIHPNLPLSRSHEKHVNMHMRSWVHAEEHSYNISQSTAGKWGFFASYRNTLLSCYRYDVGRQATGMEWRIPKENQLTWDHNILELKLNSLAKEWIIKVSAGTLEGNKIGLSSLKHLLPY